MTKKKPVIDKPNRIQINQTRQAGKVNKTSLFDNIQLRHPYEDIFAASANNVQPSTTNQTNNQPSKEISELLVVDQKTPSDIAPTNSIGYPSIVGLSNVEGKPSLEGIPNITGNPTGTGTVAKNTGTPKNDGHPKLIEVPKTDVLAVTNNITLKENFPVSPARDFTKTPNSIIKYILAHGLFKGKSKQVYDYFWSQSRGNIKPLRTTQRTNKQIKDGTGIGSKNTVADAIKHLEEIGLIVKTTTAGESGGNTYEIFTPEELGYPNLIGHPSLNGVPDGIGVTTQKSGYPGYPETGIPNSSEVVNKSTTYDASKTSFKDINTTDDGFANFIEKFQELAKEIIGQKFTKREVENFGKLADLLILEFRIAARRTNNVSSIPAFLTEVLRRKLQTGSASMKTREVKDDKLVKSDDGRYEIKPLDKKGREAALIQLQEFAEDEFLQDFKKWYTEKDWKWLMEQIKP